MQGPVISHPSSSNFPRYHPPLIRARDPRFPSRTAQSSRFSTEVAVVPRPGLTVTPPALTAERLVGIRQPDPKHTPLLSRLLAPGFASSVTGSDNATTGRTATVTSPEWGVTKPNQSLSATSVTRQQGKIKSYTCGNETQQSTEAVLGMGKLKGSARTAHDETQSSREDPNHIGRLSHRPVTRTRTDHGDGSSGERNSDTGLISTSDSPFGFTMKHSLELVDSKAELEPIVGDVTRVSVVEKGQGSSNPEPSGADDDEDEVEQEDAEVEQETDDEEEEAETGLGSTERAYSGMFHRVPHEYVNDTDALAAVEAATAESPDDEERSEDEEPEQTAAEVHTEEDENLDVCFAQLKASVSESPRVHSTATATSNEPFVNRYSQNHESGSQGFDHTEESVPVLHPKRPSLSRVARTRSQPNVLRDYVNLPDASFVHWLTTTAGVCQHRSPTFTDLPPGLSVINGSGESEPITPPLPPPPPPPYRPLPYTSHTNSGLPMGPAEHGAEATAAFYRLHDPNDPSSFTGPMSNLPGGEHIGPFFPTGPLGPSLYGIPGMGSARFLLNTNPISGAHASKLLTTTAAMGSWTMHCCAQVLPHTNVCDSTNTSKVDEGSGAAVRGNAGNATAQLGTSTSPPECAHSNPIEMDIHALWKENQQLRHLLHEATVRLQYVDVLECHLQRLSLLVESMLASHHRQCELDQQLHGCPNPDPCGVVPLRPLDMMMLVPHTMPANPGSLPAMPTCMGGVPHYHPFPVAPPVCPVLTTLERHAGLNHYPVRNADMPCHERHPIGDRAPLPRRSMRPPGNTHGWPRTVSLDRADEFVAPGLSDSTGYRGDGGGPCAVDKTVHAGRDQLPQKRVRVATDDTLLPTRQHTQPMRQPAPVTHLPFRSVQVTRRRFQPQFGTHPSSVAAGNACPTVQNHPHYLTPPSSASEKVQSLVTPSSVAPSNESGNRPVGVSLITKQPKSGDDEAVKLLSPSSEFLPLKTAVSSVYQVASACRVCLADSGDKSTQTATFVALPSRQDSTQDGSSKIRTSHPAGEPPAIFTVRVSSAANHPPQSWTQRTSTSSAIAKSTVSHAQRAGHDEPTASSSGRNPSEVDQIMKRPATVGTHIRVTENDGSGSYEGISPSQSTEFKKQVQQHSELTGGQFTESRSNTDDQSSCLRYLKPNTNHSNRQLSAANDRIVSFPLGSPRQDPHMSRYARGQLQPSPAQDSAAVDYPSPQPLSPRLDSPLQGVELGGQFWFDPVYSASSAAGTSSGQQQPLQRQQHYRPTRPVSHPPEADPWCSPHDTPYFQPMQQINCRTTAVGHNAEIIPDPCMPSNASLMGGGGGGSGRQATGPRLLSPQQQPPPSRYAQHRPSPCVGQRSATPLQVHFASPPPGPPSGYTLSRFSQPDRATQPRNLTLDSIVSPHLLRRQYCYE